MKATRILSLSLLATCVLAVVPALAQEPAAGFEGQVRVTEVLLDVLVTDDKGNVILGLGPSDFVVKSEGEVVDVTSATFYSNRRYVDTAQVADRLGIEESQVPVDRFFILFFHEQRRLDQSLTRNALAATRRAVQWVKEEMLPSDWVAVVSWDARLRIHQDFTTDDAAIINALKEVAKGKDPGDVWSSRVAAHEGPSLAVNLPSPAELRRQTTRVYGGLEELAEAAGYIIGRKNLLLFSLGFGELGEFGNYNPDERYYPPMMQTLNDNNVAVYSISWVENVRDVNPAWGQLGNGLSQLSADTGGRYYFNFVDFKEPLQQIAEDNNGYYLLSYSAEHQAGSEGYAEVDVETVNPNFVVRARQGYRYGS